MLLKHLRFCHPMSMLSPGKKETKIEVNSFIELKVCGSHKFLVSNNVMRSSPAFFEKQITHKLIGLAE